MAAKFSVNIKIGGQLAALRHKVLENPAVMTQVMAQWTRMYAAFIQRRFNKFSQGGGDWPALALSTINARRKGRKLKNPKRSSLARDTQGEQGPAGRLVNAGGVFSILVDSGLLKRSLNPELINPGPVSQIGYKHVMVARIGGGAVYSGTSLTVRDIIGFHQYGGPHLPQRKILVDPDDATKQQMAKAGKRIILGAIKHA